MPPAISDGRSTTDGTGHIGFVNSNPNIPGTSNSATQALSVTVVNAGNGTPVFAGQNSTVGNVVIELNAFLPGTNITFDTTTNPGNIIINASGGGSGGSSRFVQLLDTPMEYTNYSIIYSGGSSINYVPAPTVAGQVLYYTGNGFSYKNVLSNVGITSSTGQITIAGSPITSTGTFNINLSAVGSAGTYNQITTDIYGRVIAGSNNSASQGVSLVGDISGSGSTGQNISTTLASIVAAGTFINFSIDTKGRVTSARSLTLTDLTTLGAAPINSPTFTETGGNYPAGPTPPTASNNTFLATTAFVKAQGYLVAPIVLTGDVSGTSSGTSGNITATLSSIVAAGTYTSVTVNSKGLVIAGSTGGGGSGSVTSVAITSPNSTLKIGGVLGGTQTVTSSGTFQVDLPVLISAGTYSNITVDNNGRVSNIGSLTYSNLPAQVQVTLFPFSFPSSPASNVDIIVPIVQNTVIPNGLTNSLARAINPASDGTATFTLSYIRSGTQTTIANMAFAVSSQSGSISYALSNSLTLVSGDILVMTTPTTVDSTLGNVGITIYALKA